MRVAIERRPETLFARQRHQRAGIVEGPGMVRATKETGVTLVEGTHCGTAVRAPIRPQSNRSGVVTSEKHWLASHASSDELARSGHLAFMADEHPAPMVDPFQFAFEDVRVGI